MKTQDDWSAGQAKIIVDECNACGHKVVFRQAFCPACGSTDLSSRVACGIGRIWSITVVHRGPSKEDTKDGPYAIALVDLDEGIRVMVRAQVALDIGASVRIAFDQYPGKVLPFAVQYES